MKPLFYIWLTTAFSFHGPEISTLKHPEHRYYEAFDFMPSMPTCRVEMNPMLFIK